eukprot:698032-Rhodomonas_salina.1
MALRMWAGLVLMHSRKWSSAFILDRRSSSQVEPRSAPAAQLAELAGRSSRLRLASALAVALS